MNEAMNDPAGYPEHDAIERDGRRPSFLQGIATRPDDARSAAGAHEGDAIISTRPFHFKLQNVLDFRAREVENVQQRVAIEVARRMEIAQQIEGIDADVAAAYADYRSLSAQDQFPVAASAQFSGYLARMKTRRAERQQALAEQETRLNAVREELKAARVRQKSLELLRDKQAKRFNAFLLKEEEKFLSEMTLIRMAHA